MAQRLVRDPDEHLRDQGRVARLGRRLAGRRAVRPGLAEVVGKVAEQVVCYRADVRPVRFVALYLLAGLGGSVASYLFAAPTALTAGASGAVFGLFSALFIALKRLKRDTSSVIPIIVVNLLFTFAVPGISISGHLGGLVTGALAGLGLAYAPPKYRTPVQIAVVGGLFVVLALITLAVSTSR